MKTTNRIRVAYCVHIDEPNEYISKIYSWELPENIGVPCLGDYITVENLEATANVVFLFDREVTPIEQIERKKVLAISEYKHSYETNLSLLKKISDEILRGTHTPDDFLGVEDGIFLGWRTGDEELGEPDPIEPPSPRRERISDREYASQLENFFENLQPADDFREGEWYLFNPRVTNKGRGEGEVDIVLIRKNCRNEPFIAATAMCGDTKVKGASLETYWGAFDKENIVARANGDGGFVAENRGHFYLLDRNIPVRFRLMTIGEVIESLNITFEETPKPLEKTDLEFEVQLNNNYKIRLRELKLEEGVVNVPTFHKRHDTNFCSTILAKEVIKHLADDGKIYTAQVYERGGWYHLSGITQMNMVMPLLFNATRDMREAMGESYITAFHNLCDKGIRFGRYFYKKEVAYSPCKCCDELHTLFSLR